jgi:purine-nucleoside phosphorylase
MRAATEHLIRAFDGMLPETAIILGSGLGGLTKDLTNAIHIPYGELDGFPQSGVSGHAGEVVAGYLAGYPLVLLSGRAHYYESGDAAAMRIPLEILKAIGIRRLILTNAAGSLREDMPPGSVMMITDHINWSGLNPLIGEQSDERFTGLTNAYSGRIMEAFRKSSQGLGETLHEGVYMWFSGPSFETPAEIRAARLLGADAVGMSTVPEIILGRFLGLECAAFSVITNYGAGMTGAELSHAETREMGPEGGVVLATLIGTAIKEFTR